MIATISYQKQTFTADLSKPIDLSIPLSNNELNPIAWYIEKPQIEPVRFGSWVGSVQNGATTNFNNITFNPHGHGTHTECLGHITRDFFSINQSLKTFFFTALLISIEPEQQSDDFVITRKQLELLLDKSTPQAVIIRSLPNLQSKQSKNYSHTNPPYILEEAAVYLREKGVIHLLIDLPSVDKEKDEGKLLAHKAFWNVKNTQDINADARFDATITELIFVPDDVQDGLYLLNLTIASFENDASPSKPTLYLLV